MRPVGPGLARSATAVVALVALLGTPALAGCGGSDPPGSGTSGEQAESAQWSPLSDPERVGAMIKERFGGSPEMRRLTMNDSGFSLEVRDPETRENLDDHDYYAGRWSVRPVRVGLREIEELDQRTFTLDDIDLAVVAGLMSMALEGLNLEGETITTVSYDRLAGGRPRVYIGVDGLRGSGRLLADADGSGADISRS